MTSLEAPSVSTTDAWAVARRRAASLNNVGGRIALGGVVLLGLLVVFAGLNAPGWLLVVAMLAGVGCLLGGAFTMFAVDGAHCLLDPAGTWRWLRQQPTLTSSTALDQAAWRSFVFLIALLTWFGSLVLESDFEAARSKATTSGEMFDALFLVVEGVATVVAFVVLTVPPVWMWRLFRRGINDKTIPAEGLGLGHFAGAWFIILLAASFIWALAAQALP